MGEFDLSSSLSGAAMAAFLAQGLVKTQAVPDASANTIKDAASTAIAGVASTLARSTQLTDAVQAAEKARLGSSGSNTLNASQESQGVAQVRNLVSASLGTLLKDVQTLVKAVGLDGAAAREVEKKLFAALVEKVDALTESPSALQAATAGKDASVLGASGIEVVINNRSGAVSARVDEVTLSSREDFLKSTLSSSDPYGIGGYGSSSLMVGLDGRSADLSTAPGGVYFDVRGDSGREFSSLLTSPSVPASVSGGGGDRQSAESNSRTAAASPRAQARAAETLFSSGGDRFSAGGAGSGLPARVDSNQDGMADQQDSNYQSLLIMRSGGGLSPLAEGGVTRIQFDAATQIATRVDSSGLVPSVEAARKDGSVTPAFETGFDLSA